MTGILDRIRNTSVEDLDKVTGDFSDAPAAVYRPRVEREMVRIVKGADDLKPTVRVANPNAGMVRTDGSGPVDNRPFKGQPSDAQRNFMNSLMEQLEKLDRDAWQQGMDYVLRMDEAGAWTPGREGNASRWITRLKDKIAALKAAAPATATPVQDNTFADVPDGRYAVQDSGPGDWKFYRVTTGKAGGPYAGRRFVKVQASDTEHPIRNVSTRKAIMTTIETMGWKESMAAYGQHIGSCGRCGRTLTDAESRARGIGPDCWGNM